MTSIFWVTSLILVHSTVSVGLELRGAGASFPYKVYAEVLKLYDRWRSNYIRLSSTYNSIGSGGGKSRFKGTLDNIVAQKDRIVFAGSDSTLSENDYIVYPGIQMMPAIAGAIVVACHIPELTKTSQKLCLSQKTLVDIYLGKVTHWDDHGIVSINPNISLPHKQIVPLARMDKSGSTSVFTSALTAFSAEWKSTYGQFEDALNTKTWMHPKWNNSVVKYFGDTTTGLLSLLTSIKYSIGYVSAADTSDNGDSIVSHALIQNQLGAFTDGFNPQAIQQAMEFFVANMTSRLTVSLINAVNINSYPIATYTYFIVSLNRDDLCDESVELYGFMKYFFTEKEVSATARKLNFIPTTTSIYNIVNDRVLSKMKCKGKSLADLWKAKRQEELSVPESNNTAWLLPTAISVSAAVIVISILTFIVIRQKMLAKKLLNQNLWYIDIDEIMFIPPKKQGGSSGTRSLFSFRSDKDETDSTSVISASNNSDKDSGSEEYQVSQVLQWPGVFNGAPVGIRLLETKRVARKMSTETKRTLLLMIDKIHHVNITKLLGLTIVDNDYFVVSELCHRGNLKKVLQNTRYEFSRAVKASLIVEICTAMLYLRDHDLVHGCLRSCNCFIDAKWTVKIGDWEYCRYYTVIQKKLKHKKPPLEYIRESMLGEHPSDEQTVEYDIYVAPEIIRSDFSCLPTEASDVYSCSIIFYEIFTRQLPFESFKKDFGSPKELITAIVKHSLRPNDLDDIPLTFRQIMESSWSDSPRSRPTFEGLLKIVKKIFPHRKYMLQSMFDALEVNHHRLEDELELKNNTISALDERVSTLMRAELPDHYADLLLADDIVKPEFKRFTAVLAVQITGLATLSDQNRPFEVNNIVDSFSNVLRELANQFTNIYTVPITNDVYVFISGIRGKSSRKSLTNVIQLCEKIHACIRYANNNGDITGFSFLPSGIDKDLSFSVRSSIHCGCLNLGIVSTSGTPRLHMGGNSLHVLLHLLYMSQADRIHVSENVRKMALSYSYSRKGEQTTDGNSTDDSLDAEVVMESKLQTDKMKSEFMFEKRDIILENNKATSTYWLQQRPRDFSALYKVVFFRYDNIAEGSLSIDTSSSHENSDDFPFNHLKKTEGSPPPKMLRNNSMETFNNSMGNSYNSAHLEEVVVQMNGPSPQKPVVKSLFQGAIKSSMVIPMCVVPPPPKKSILATNQNGHKPKKVLSFRPQEVDQLSMEMDMKMNGCGVDNYSFVSENIVNGADVTPL